MKREYERRLKGKKNERPYDLRKKDPEPYRPFDGLIKSSYCHAESEFDKITVYGMKEDEYLLIKCSDNEFLVGGHIEGDYDVLTRQVTMWYPSVTEWERTREEEEGGGGQEGFAGKTSSEEIND